MQADADAMRDERWEIGWSAAGGAERPVLSIFFNFKFHFQKLFILLNFKFNFKSS